MRPGMNAWLRAFLVSFLGSLLSQGSNSLSFFRHIFRVSCAVDPEAERLVWRRRRRHIDGDRLCNAASF